MLLQLSENDSYFILTLLPSYCSFLTMGPHTLHYPLRGTLSLDNNLSQVDLSQSTCMSLQAE